MKCVENKRLSSYVEQFSEGSDLRCSLLTRQHLSSEKSISYPFFGKRGKKFLFSKTVPDWKPNISTNTYARRPSHPHPPDYRDAHFYTDVRESASARLHPRQEEPEGEHELGPGRGCEQQGGGRVVLWKGEFAHLQRAIRSERAGWDGCIWDAGMLGWMGQLEGLVFKIGFRKAN